MGAGEYEADWFEHAKRLVCCLPRVQEQAWRQCDTAKSGPPDPCLGHRVDGVVEVDDGKNARHSLRLDLSTNYASPASPAISITLATLVVLAPATRRERRVIGAHCRAANLDRQGGRTQFT